MIKRVLIALFILILLLGLIAASGLVFVSSSYGSRWISEKLHSVFLQETGFKISFKNIDVKFFPPRLMLDNFEAKGVNFDAICVVSEVEVAPDPLALLSGTFAIEEIYLGAPKCDVHLKSSDLEKLKKTKDPLDSEFTELDLSILPEFEVIALSDAQFVFSIDDPDSFGFLEGSIEGFYLDITGRRKDVEHIEIRALLEKAQGRLKTGEYEFFEKVEQVEFRASVSNDHVNFRYFRGNLAKVVVDSRDIIIPVSLAKGKLSAAFISIGTLLDDFSRFPFDLPIMKGSAGFEGQVEVDFENKKEPEFSVKGLVKLQNGVVDDFVIGDVHGEISLNNRGISVSQLEVFAAMGSVILDGSLAFDEALTIDAHAKLTDIELANLLENMTLENSYVMQKMTGEASVTGSIIDLNLKGKTNLSIRDHFVFDDGYRKSGKNTLLSIPSVNVRGPFHITEESISAKGFVVSRGNSTVNVDMEFGFSMKKGWNLHAYSTRMDLADIAQVVDIDIGGVGSIDCKIRAPGWDVPYIVGKADLKKVHFLGYDFDQVNSKVIYDGRNLIFEDLHVKTIKSKYSSKEVVLDFDAPGGMIVTATVDIEKAHLQDLARTYHVDTKKWGRPSGNISGLVDVTYYAKDDSALVHAKLAHDGITFWDEPFGPGKLEFSYEEDIFSLGLFELSKGRGKVSLNGQMSAKDDLNFTAILTNVDLGDIALNTVKDLGIRGNAQAFAIIKGNLNHPEANASVRLLDTIYKGISYGPSEFELDLDGSQLGVRGTVANRALTIEYALADFDSKRFELEAFVSKLDIAKFGGFGDGYKAVITGELVLEGRLEKDARLQGDIQLFETDIAVDDFGFKNKNPVLISMRDNRMEIGNTRFEGKDVIFDIGGNADTKSFRLISRGVASLRGVSEFIDFVSTSEGKLSFNAVLGGSWDNPAFRGGAKVEGAALQLDGFEQKISNISGTIDMGQGRIRFQDFTGRVAKGTVDINGWIGLDGLNIDDYRIFASVADIELALVDGLSIRASTIRDGLVLTPGKNRDLPFIGGDVEITRFRYTEPIHMIRLSDLDLSGFADRRKKVSRPKLYDQSKDTLEYDVRLHGQRNLTILNNLLDTRFRIDEHEDPLRIVGTNQSFGFLGRILSTDGDIYFAGKTFEIRNAIISFQDPLRPDNPYFRVTADVDVRDWRITITAEGTVEDYELKLSAQPYLSQEDIIMLLLSGMTKQEHTQMGGQGMSMTLAPLLDDVSAGIIPVEVRVYSEYSEKAGTDTTRIALGKRVAKDIWVQVSSSVGEEQDVEGLVTYKINDNFSLSASYDNKNDTSKAGNWGVDLRFRLEF